MFQKNLIVLLLVLGGVGLLLLVLVVHDHWGENSDLDLYYLRAGQAFLNDAKQIALNPAVAEPSRDQRSKRLDSEMARQLESDLVKQGLDVAKMFDVSWAGTSEPSIRLSYRVRAPAGMRPGLPGFPSARLKLNPRLKLLDPDKEGWTVIGQFSDQKPEANLDYRVRLTDA